MLLVLSYVHYSSSLLLSGYYYCYCFTLDITTCCSLVLLSAGFSCYIVLGLRYTVFVAVVVVVVITIINKYSRLTA